MCIRDSFRRAVPPSGGRPSPLAVAVNVTHRLAALIWADETVVPQRDPGAWDILFIDYFLSLIHI